jgi:hypothetical protein
MLLMHFAFIICVYLCVTFLFVAAVKYESFGNLSKPLPIPVAVRSKAWVFGRSLTGIVGSNPA